MTATAGADIGHNALVAYVPRLVLEWAADCPDERYRPVEGSLAFCDLSGFTAMSEKLAKLGRRGAEELSDVINTLFGALLGDAAAFGGSMLKYGGDAVLVFFWGGGHEARAAAATHRMRATLRRIGTVRTAGGTVRVRMSVGVHSGTFDAFLVGESHRELLVCGAGATVTCAMETAADAGEILLSAATAAALTPSCVGAPKDDGFLLRRAPKAEERDPDGWGETPDVDPAPFVPLGLRSYLGDGAADAEHRHVTVGFIAFGGVDALLRERGPEVAATVLDAFITACQHAFERYGVCFLTADVYGDGGKVIGTTGAPLAYEDNEERLLRAAREIADGEHGLDVHIGLNRGYVFSGDVGPRFRRTYTILGDAVNTAARVMASCTEHNQVRAMPEVVERALSRFETVEQSPFAAKGKALPLVTVAVGEPLGQRVEVTRPELVGRDAELLRLESAWSESASGSGGLLALVGDAGVGKSRLLDELATQAESTGASTLTTYAERYERDTAYFVVRQLLAAVLGLREGPSAEEIANAVAKLAPEQAEWSPLLARAFAVGMPSSPAVAALDESNTADRFAGVLVDLLAARVPGPALWIVDNADLIDAASLGVLHAVAPRLRHYPWLVALAQRSPDAVVVVGDERLIIVAPLDQSDSIRLARTLDASLLPHDAAQFAERSGGNPMFLRQLVAAGTAGATMADSVETAIGARIDALVPTDRAVLRTASVLGGRFSAGSLRELLDDGRMPDLGRLNDFVARAEGDEYVFRQAIYREVAYAGLTYKRRRALHHAAGRAFEAIRGDEGPGLGRLSLHFHEAHDWERSWRYSRQAGERAYLSAAKPVSVTFFERALEAGKRAGAPKEELAVVANELGQALYFAGRVTDAERAFRQAFTQAPPGSTVAASAAHRMAVTLVETDRVAQCRRWLARGHATLEGSASAAEPGLRVGLRGTEIALALRQGRLDLANDAARLAVEAAAEGDDSDKGQAHQLLALVLHYSGDVSGAIDEARLAIDHLLRTNFRGLLGDAYNALGTFLGSCGQWSEAVEAYGAASRALRAAGNPARDMLASANVAEVLIDQGRYGEAAPMVAEALRVFRLTDSQFSGFALELAGRISARDQPGAHPRPEYDPAEDSLGYARAMLVELALASGDGAEALVAIQEAEGTLFLQRPELMRGLAERLLDKESAKALLEAAYAATGDDPFGRALALVATGRDAEARPILSGLGVVTLPFWLTAP